MTSLLGRADRQPAGTSRPGGRGVSSAPPALTGSAYDEFAPPPEETERAVAFLLAQGRPARAVELGVGTGRVAVPLARQGVRVTGIDIEEAMLAHLRQKDGGNAVEAVLGDFRSLDYHREFDLAYAVFSTLFELPTPEAQAQCFAAVAGALRPGGRFVVEAALPNGQEWAAEQVMRTLLVTADGILLEAGRGDVVRQVFRGRKIFVCDDGSVRTWRSTFRWSTPAENDLMARSAGLCLRERWSGWCGERLTAQSKRHVSVYTLDNGASGYRSEST
jgi:SAM-dependent methyltransferase